MPDVEGDVDVYVVNDEKRCKARGFSLVTCEAKATGTAMDIRELRRLEHLRRLLPSARVDRPPGCSFSAGPVSRPSLPPKPPRARTWN